MSYLSVYFFLFIFHLLINFSIKDPKCYENSDSNVLYDIRYTTTTTTTTSTTVTPTTTTTTSTTTSSATATSQQPTTSTSQSSSYSSSPSSSSSSTQSNVVTVDHITLLSLLMTNYSGDLTGCLLNCTYHGFCMLDQNTKIVGCNCSENYTGVSCQQDLRACSSSPCLNGAICIDVQTCQLT